MDKRSVLVTGGAGFIGSHLVLALLEKGHDVTVIDDLSNGLQSNVDLFEGRAEFVQASVTNLDDVLAAAKGKDSIFHLAAISNVQQTLDQPTLAHAVNTTGTLNVLEAARANNAHVIYSSSAAVYGDTEANPKNEAGPTHPLSLYGSQKLFGEYLLKNYGKLFNVTGVSLRYFNVFGARQRPDSPYSGVISVFLDRALNNEEIVIHGDGNQYRDFIAVEDVVQANLLALEHRQVCKHPFNVCTGATTSINALANQLISATESTSTVSHTDPREGDIQKSCGNPRMIQSQLKFELNESFAEGIKRLVENLKS